MISRASAAMVAVMGAALLSACATTAATNGQMAAAGAPAPVAAQVAVLQSLFGANAASLQAASQTYCVRSGGEGGSADMTQAVVAALRDPKAKPASACEIVEGDGGIIDRQTRQRALMFTVATEHCPSATECLIRGGYYEGNLSAQTNLYRARLANGRWTVSLVEMGPMS